MIELNRPQRQSSKGILIFILSAFRKLFKYFFPILLIIITRKQQYPDWALYAILLTILAASLYGVLDYLSYYFYIDEEKGEFVVEKGVFNKTRTVIQLQKIQQVNLSQKLIHQIFDIYRLELETAGSSKTEVELYAISDDVADILRERLISVQSQEVPAEATPTGVVPKNPKLLSISVSSLLKVGITSNYIKTLSLLFVFAITAMDYLLRIFRWNDSDVYHFLNELPFTVTIGLLLPLIIFLICMVVVIIINLVRTLIRYNNYSITKKEGNLNISYGLFETRNIIVRPSRIQYSYLSQNYFQRLMNIFEFKVFQVHSDAEKGKRKNGVEIPGISSAEKEALFQQLYTSSPVQGEELKPVFFKFFVRFFYFSLLPSLLLLALSIYDKTSDYLFYAALLFISTAFYQWRTFRKSRLYFDENFIIIRRGFWDVKTYFIEPHKIQMIKSYQYFWHKGRNIGSIVIYTAGGALHFTISNHKELCKRINFWLYQIESNNKNWN